MFRLRKEKRSSVVVGIIFGLVFLDLIVDRGVIQSGKAVMNAGGIWGLFGGAWWWPWLSILGLTVLVWWGMLATKKDMAVAFALLMAGGLSNALDRFWYGGVIDYLYYPWLSVYGNMADIWLILGVFLWWWSWRQKTSSKTNKKEYGKDTGIV